MNSELLNDYRGYASFKPTQVYKWIVHSKHSMVALFTGNQLGKTASVAHQYVSRVLGTHPVPKRNINYYECINRSKLKAGDITKKEYYSKHKNKDSATWNVFTKLKKCPECGGDIVLHKRESRVFRFCSENLPGQSANIGKDGDSAEVKNTQYPAIKKWLPKHLIKKDITTRMPSMIIKDPHGFDDIIFEFVSYSQEARGTRGVQRVSVWYDEQPPLDFRNEQIPRLLAEDGDEILSLTPCEYLTWCYDEIFEKAHVYYRTKAICEALTTVDYKPEQREVTDNKTSIAVIMAATDDNPTLEKDVINQMFEKYEPGSDELMIRRYGIFKQVAGRIFKNFDYQTHVIDNDKYFPEGIPKDWVHGRGIDFHPRTPWAVGAMSLSPDNEAFIWLDHSPSPEKFTIDEISDQIASKSKDYHFLLNLIDPLADATKLDKTTARQRLNDSFLRLYKESLSPQTYWMNWDTKGEAGRDEIRSRLKNAKKVGKPFNNTVIEKGKQIKLPTLWIFKSCKHAAESMKKWRWAEYSSARYNDKDEKNVPEQKWSHINMVWEALFKEQSFKAGINMRYAGGRPVNYYTGHHARQAAR